MTKKAPANVDLKKKVLVSSAQMGGSHKKVSSAVKMKIKSQMTKNFQKGFQKGKSVQLKKPISENSMSKLKKKVVKERVDAADMEMPDLTSCLAAVATEFAAGGENIKKVTHLRRSSHDSSPGSSQGSKSPSSNQQPPHLRKEAKEVPPPLSPNASSKLTFLLLPPQVISTLVGQLLHRSLQLSLSANSCISSTLPPVSSSPLYISLNLVYPSCVWSALWVFLHPIIFSVFCIHPFF
jgi:hypothetical protein